MEPVHKVKNITKGEYLVAIRTGLNYWHILTGREFMVTKSDAEDYANNFKSQFQTVILRVEDVITEPTAKGHKS